MKSIEICKWCGKHCGNHECPNCHFLYRPERSKREDLIDLGHDLIGIPTTEESWCINCNEESHVIEKLRMRCSEHDGNIVREVQ